MKPYHIAFLFLFCCCLASTGCNSNDGGVVEAGDEAAELAEEVDYNDGYDGGDEQ